MINDIKPRAVLVGVDITSESSPVSPEESLYELSRLTASAGCKVLTHTMQKREKPDPKYYIGRGKVDELHAISEELSPDLIIFDAELSPSQITQLEDRLETSIWDRTDLILEIFRDRANTREAKLQVELARLEYLLPRVTGKKGEELSRLAGGIGTKGKGEQKSELDRRHIKERIQETKKRLGEVKKQREQKRSYRKRHNLPVTALVGYTNAGKSTLLTKLTGTVVDTKNQLFNTLDPKLGELSLSSGTTCLLSDTVGFINKLPHHLVAAFEATLEEVVEADLILHVIDVTSEKMEAEIESVNNVLTSLGVKEKPTIYVYNKMDLLDDPDVNLYDDYPDSIPVSAIKEQGFQELKSAIQAHIEANWVIEDFFVPYDMYQIMSSLYYKGEVVREKYHNTGSFVTVRMPQKEVSKVRVKLEKKGGNTFG